MLILISGATATLRKFPNRSLGKLIVPGAGNKSTSLDLGEGRWAMDNGAFKDFDPAGFHRMLQRFEGQRGCLFVTAPDVVGDAATTLEQFPHWARLIRMYGFPVALVAQDGLTVATTPWADFDALFLGGTTDFKLGTTARTLAAYATARGKWVHMGRVNSQRRLEYADAIGCDSVDGSGFSKWPNANIPLGLQWIERLTTAIDPATLPGYTGYGRSLRVS